MDLSASTILNRLLTRGKFRHVQVLLKLAELGSVQRTADAIGLTQSSVTQTLAYLERLLETQLFERHARGVHPTLACRDLLPVARQLLQGVAESSEVVAAHRRGSVGLIRLIASAAAVHGLLIEGLLRFNNAVPTVQVQLREAEGEDQLLAISRNEVDLVACREPLVVPQAWQFVPLLDDRLVIVCRADNPLARARRVGWEQLARETWMLLPAGLAARAHFDDLVEKFPSPPKVHPLVTRTTTMMWELLRSENLLTLLPLNLVRPLVNSGELVELQCGYDMPLKPLGLLIPEGELGHGAARLASFLRDHFARGRARKRTS